MRLLNIILSIYCINLFASIEPITDSELKEVIKIAQKGNRQAQYELGLYFQNKVRVDVSYLNMNENGRFTENSNPEDYYLDAVKWFRMAAENNHKLAQFSLGVLYNNGCGVPQNRIESIAWFSLAGRTDKQIRAEFYESSLAKLSPDMAEKVQKRALELEKEIDAKTAQKNK
jgi:TPR repeat protein